jgi:hypothetical protein
MTLLRRAVEDTLQGPPDLVRVPTGLHMHFIVPLEILTKVDEEDLCLAAQGESYSLPSPGLLAGQLASLHDCFSARRS